MSDNTRKIIDYAINDQGSDLRDALYAEIHDRITSHMEAHKQALAQGLMRGESYLHEEEDEDDDDGSDVEGKDDDEDDKKLVKKMVKGKCLNKESADDEWDDEEEEEEEDDDLNESRDASEPTHPILKDGEYDHKFNNGKGIITHLMPKKHLDLHKDWMNHEGHKLVTSILPKGHPKRKTHVGLVSHNDDEDDSNEYGHKSTSIHSGRTMDHDKV